MAKFKRALSPDKFLSPQEQGDLCSNLERWRETNLRDTTLFLLMLETGARPGEALRLTWADVNFEDQSVFLSTLKRGNDRMIPLSKNIIYRLQELKEASKPHPTIFKISYPHLVRMWNDMRPVKKPIHSLRHTFAVNFYANSKFNLRLTQQALGHNNLASTEFYLQIHGTIDDFRKVIGG